MLPYQICHSKNARLLIDDSAEHAIAFAKDANARIPVLLFGDYSWNQRLSYVEEEKDFLGFEERLKAEGGREWWREEHADDVLPKDIVTRVKNWGEVIEHIKNDTKLALANAL